MQFTSNSGHLFFQHGNLLTKHGCMFSSQLGAAAYNHVYDALVVPYCALCVATNNKWLKSKTIFLANKLLLVKHHVNYNTSLWTGTCWLRFMMCCLNLATKKPAAFEFSAYKSTITHGFKLPWLAWITSWVTFNSALFVKEKHKCTPPFFTSSNVGMPLKIERWTNTFTSACAIRMKI